MTAQASKTDPLATLKHYGGEGRMAPAAVVVPNVAVWNHKKLAPKWLPRLPKRTLRHIETPWQWRADGACGLQLAVPNITFWTHQKWDLGFKTDPEKVQLQTDHIGFRNDPFPILKHHADQGWMAIAVCGWLYLPMLPECTKNYLQINYLSWKRNSIEIPYQKGRITQKNWLSRLPTNKIYIYIYFQIYFEK